MEFMAEAVIVLFGFSMLMFVFAVSEVAFLSLDKLYKHIQRTKEKAPRTLSCSKEQETKPNKSVA